MTIKSSLVIPQQLPSYIREGISGNIISQNQISPYNENYENFVSFLQAYYEFLESSGNVYGETKNIISYKDIDRTLAQFEDYFFNEFLQYFPKESLTDGKFLIKFAKELYENKSAPNSFKFLFRALFNSDCELYNTKESVLVASGGKWVRSRYVRLSTVDPKFLNAQNYKLFGESSKSIGKIQRSQVSGDKTKVFLTDIVREFYSGEFVKVVDDFLNEVLFDGQVLRAKIVGSISKVEINPNFRGNLYNPGDPVVFVGGTNPESETPITAKAIVGETTKGSVVSINVVDGSNGFRFHPNTIVSFTGGSGGSGASAVIKSLDANNSSLVNYIANDVISLYSSVQLDSNSYGFLANPSANANTYLKDAFEFISFETYAISEIELLSRGSNYFSAPEVQVTSYINVANNTIDLSSLGILCPMQIKFAGFNYSNGDVINIVGGSGFGAFANVKTVNANGSIEEVQYVNDENNLYPLGGYLYSLSGLPKPFIQSSNNKILEISTANSINSGQFEIELTSTSNLFAGMYVSGNGIPVPPTKSFGYFNSNTTVTYVDETNNKVLISNRISSNVANGDIFTFDGTSILTINSILGDAERVTASVDEVGSIRSFVLQNPGEDYISNPEVVLKILDVVVINVKEIELPNFGELVYQGDAENPQFLGFVDSLVNIPYQPQKTYKLRIYSYNGSISSDSILYIDRFGKNSKTLSFEPLTSYNQENFVSGIKKYGDGNAKATAEFINGTILLQGRYQTQDGFLSSEGVLQSALYNSHTYSLTVEKEFSKYKDILYGILHPVGKKVFAKNSVKSNNFIELETKSGYHRTTELKYISYPEVYGVLETPNKLQIVDLNKETTGTSLSGIITTNTYIHLTSTNFEEFYSKIEEVDDSNDIIYLQDHNILTYSNIAYGYVNGNSVILTSLTRKYDVVNNSEYSNELNYLYDMVFANDKITISNNYTATINSIDYVNRIIYANTTLNPSGDANTPSLISITRNFVANSIVIDYRLEYNYVVASGNTVTGISIDGFYVVDENDKLIYVLTEI